MVLDVVMPLFLDIRNVQKRASSNHTNQEAQLFGLWFQISKSLQTILPLHRSKRNFVTRKSVQKHTFALTTGRESLIGNHMDSLNCSLYQRLEIRENQWERDYCHSSRIESSSRLGKTAKSPKSFYQRGSLNSERNNMKTT